MSVLYYTSLTAKMPHVPRITSAVMLGLLGYRGRITREELAEEVLTAFPDSYSTLHRWTEIAQQSARDAYTLFAPTSYKMPLGKCVPAAYPWLIGGPSDLTAKGQVTYYTPFSQQLSEQLSGQQKLQLAFDAAAVAWSRDEIACLSWSPTECYLHTYQAETIVVADPLNDDRVDPISLRQLWTDLIEPTCTNFLKEYIYPRLTTDLATTYQCSPDWYLPVRQGDQHKLITASSNS